MTYSGAVEEVHASPPAGTPLRNRYLFSGGVENELQITS